MSEAAVFSVDNGADTPVSITFEPEIVSGGNATFRNKTIGISNLMPRMKSVTSLANANRPTNRVTFQVSLPVSKTVDGVLVLDYILRADCQFVLPERSTPDDRKNLLAFVRNGLDEDPIKGTIVDVSPIWG